MDVGTHQANAAQTTFGALLGSRTNGIGVLRLSLAIAVLVDHAFPLSGHGGDPMLVWTHGQESLGGLAVIAFFALSGYLVTRSAMHGGLLRFLWNRSLRIFPAYWAVLILTAFAVGPVLWLHDGRPLSTYFQPGVPGPYTFVTYNWTLRVTQFGIWDLLGTSTPYGHLQHGASALNGSIWTLFYEWRCYLVVALLLAGGIILRAKFVIPVLAAFAWLAQIAAAVQPGGAGKIAPWLADPFVPLFFTTFLTGATLAVYAGSIVCDDRLGLLSGLVLVGTLYYGGYATFGLPASVYFWLWLAARMPRLLCRIGARNDYSYGVYVWGFLVQQLLAAAGVYKWGYLPFLLASIAISLAIAVVSWHLLEKPALSLKRFPPDRWLAALRGRLRRRSAATQPELVLPRQPDGLVPVDPLSTDGVRV